MHSSSLLWSGTETSGNPPVGDPGREKYRPGLFPVGNNPEKIPTKADTNQPALAEPSENPGEKKAGKERKNFLCGGEQKDKNAKAADPKLVKQKSSMRAVSQTQDHPFQDFSRF